MASCKIPPKICYCVATKGRCFKPENIPYVRNLRTSLRDLIYYCGSQGICVTGRKNMGRCIPCSSVAFNYRYPLTLEQSMLSELMKFRLILFSSQLLFQSSIGNLHMLRTFLSYTEIFDHAGSPCTSNLCVVQGSIVIVRLDRERF